MFDQFEDGSHEITLHKIQCPECRIYSKTSGVLRWKYDAGIVFSIEFNEIDSVIGTEFYNRSQHERSGVGRFVSTDLTTPDWLAETDDGTRVKLYGVFETPTSSRKRINGIENVSCSFSGSATFVVVDIPSDRTLAFNKSTQEDYRMFFIGGAGARFQEQESVGISDRDGNYINFTRCSTTLSESPRVSLVSANNLVNCKPSGWLGFEKCPVDSDCEIGAFAEQSFVSFLNGEKVPFFWADRIIPGEMIRRTYFGWVRSKLKNREKITHQTLPFLDGVEIFPHGEKVLSNLPEFFQEFTKHYSYFNFLSALHPLWTALDEGSVLNDRLALASVSLERIAAYWGSCRKLVLKGCYPSSSIIWKQRTIRKSLINALRLSIEDMLSADARKSRFYKKIIKKLLKCWNKYPGCESLSTFSQSDQDELRKVVSVRITQIADPPNSVKLKIPLLDLKIDLSAEDEEALKKRNDALHGKNSGDEVEALEKEAKYFDHIRMLITRFVLKLCKYKGPYIDYASRPTSGNFEVKHLPEQHDAIEKKL